MVDIDFGDGVKDNVAADVNTNTNDGEQLANKEPDAASIDGKSTDTDINKSDDTKNSDNNKDGEPASENNKTEETDSQLTPGTELEFDGQKYKVAENGDIVDEKGTVFKAAGQVKDWLATVQKEDEVKEEEDKGFDIKKLQDEIGIEVTDNDGKPVEFSNTIEGVKAYVNSVMDIQSTEIANAALNRFYNENPIIPQFLDYIKVNGSAAGFGELRDLTGIKLDKDNDAQLEAVIRIAAKEFGNNSLNDNYLKYLKDSGGLFDEAQTQLNNLIAKDKQNLEDMQKEAAQQREAEAKQLQDFWQQINNVIESRNIGGFKIPESFTKEENGKKVIYTPNDFFNYINRRIVTDEQGNKYTAYERDLINMSAEENLNNQLLFAWLLFTGGTYKDLANMAINENKVNQLRLKSKEQRATKPIKFVSKAAKKADINDILL